MDRGQEAKICIRYRGKKECRDENKWREDKMDETNEWMRRGLVKTAKTEG